MNDRMKPPHATQTQVSNNPDLHHPYTDRRTLLAWAAVAGVSALGLGWMLRQRQRVDSLPAAVATQLWGSEFENPLGSTFKMSLFQGKPLVINFWATWCTPCVKEIPILADFYRQNVANGWQMIGLAIDQPTPVKRFMSEMNIPYPVGLAGLNGTELMKILGNDRGGLPFTVVLGADEVILMKKLGQISASDLSGLVKVS